jgi:hypothetical protein
MLPNVRPVHSDHILGDGIDVKYFRAQRNWQNNYCCWQSGVHIGKLGKGLACFHSAKVFPQKNVLMWWLRVWSCLTQSAIGGQLVQTDMEFTIGDWFLEFEWNFLGRPRRNWNQIEPRWSWNMNREMKLTSGFPSLPPLPFQS